MKKQFTIFLVITFILGLTPINFSLAITQNQINATVQILCPGENDEWFLGTGTIIDSKGIILTNKHVVTDQFENVIKYCAIGLVDTISGVPNFFNGSIVNRAEVKYYSNSEDYDVALLYLENSTNKSFPYVDVWNANSGNLKFGDNVEILGFPSIGGSTITYSKGVFSGINGNYIKTDAQIDHGNSGGGAYTPGGSFMGIPTYVIKGELSSISYLLSINSIKKWMSDSLGSQFKSIITGSSNNISQSTTTITPPITIGGPDIYKIKLDYIGFDKKQNPLSINTIDRENYIGRDTYSPDKVYGFKDPLFAFSLDDYLKVVPGERFIYLYFGKDINADPINGSGEGYYLYKIGSIQVRSYLDFEATLPNSGTYYLIMRAKDKDNNYSDRVIWRYIYNPDIIGDIKTPSVFNFYTDELKTNKVKSIEYSGNIQIIQIPYKKIYIEWLYDDRKIPVNVTGFQTNLYNIDNSYNEESYTSQNYTAINGEYIGKDSKSFQQYWYIDDLKYEVVKNNEYYFKLTIRTDSTKKEVVPFTIIYTSLSESKSQPNSQSSPSINIPKALQRLIGYILLQVESKGEAWYVNPTDSKRYYMKDGTVAYQMMRNFGVGITNANLAKIPQLGEKNKYPSLVNKMKGKILLQVENHGEAWYVNPKTGYRHYMKDGDAAYGLMRYYSLGISNKDLEKIPEGNL